MDPTMAAQREYALAEGLQPLHSFDLWGVIVDQIILGQRKIQLFKDLAAKQGMPAEEIARVIREYQDLLNGELYAVGTRKSEIIDAMDAPAFAQGILPDYATAFFTDAVAVMKAILDTGEKVMVFTSKPAEGLVEQLSVAVGHRIDDIRYADKNLPDAFRELFHQQQREGNCWVSHTADELPELIAALRDRPVFTTRPDLHQSKQQQLQGRCSNTRNMQVCERPSRYRLSQARQRDERIHHPC